jgi:hypothetical protein
LIEDSYIAGFFDGEGSLGLYAACKSRRYNLRVSINQVITPESQVLFDFLKEKFGGSFTYPKRVKEQHRQAIFWSLYGDKAADFLEVIRPHLFLKAPQVDLVLQWQRKHGSSKSQVRDYVRAENRNKEAEEVIMKMVPMKGPKRKNWMFKK